MAMPYRIATLVYCFNRKDQVLLIHRAQEPNKGLWSPFGGKLKTFNGESPYACACREAYEEAGLVLSPTDLHLTGIVSESGFNGIENWLMFLFESRVRLDNLPLPIAEGEFGFFTRADIDGLNIPRTDREKIWPLFWKNRGGFFAAHCKWISSDNYEWILEEGCDI
jgi:8-oxo-dGTP diphosphatase